MFEPAPNDRATILAGGTVFVFVRKGKPTAARSIPPELASDLLTLVARESNTVWVKG